MLHGNQRHRLQLWAALQVTLVNVIVVPLRVSERPLRIGNVAIRQTGGRIEHRVFGAGLVEKLQPLLRSGFGIECTRSSRRAISGSMKNIEAGNANTPATDLVRRLYQM